MSVKFASAVEIPHLLPGRIVHLPGRGEIFVRHHIHRDPNAPTLLLLHGWTASSDLQFFTAYEELSRDYSIVGVDHRGHGRGLRPNRPFALEDCADDAADVVRALGISSVTLVGYSMGGPISLLLWKRHPELVDAMVLQATALEWNGTRSERNRWRVGHALGPVFRRLSTPRMIRFGLRKAIPRGHELSRFIPWIIGEIRRNDQWMVSEAGRAISHFDARDFAPEVDVPAAFVLTTHDRLVPPHKQTAVAQALRADVIELHGDHLAPMQMPREFSAATRRAVASVQSRLTAE
jgi:pimeloyl-ACP methyl ester carboxylesterase